MKGTSSSLKIGLTESNTEEGGMKEDRERKSQAGNLYPSNIVRHLLLSCGSSGHEQFLELAESLQPFS